MKIYTTTIVKIDPNLLDRLVCWITGADLIEGADAYFLELGLSKYLDSPLPKG